MVRSTMASRQEILNCPQKNRQIFDIKNFFFINFYKKNCWEFGSWSGSLNVPIPVLTKPDRFLLLTRVDPRYRKVHKGTQFYQIPQFLKLEGGLGGVQRGQILGHPPIRILPFGYTVIKTLTIGGKVAGGGHS